MKKRILAGLLAAVMVFSLLGCQKAPEVEPVSTEPTAPPAPDPAQVYAEARTALDNAAAVTLDVVQITTTTVEEEDFIDETELVLTYAGLDSDAPTVWLEEEVVYEYVDEEEEDEDEEETIRMYSEIYADGTLYVEVEDEAAFSGSLTAEECAERYVPVVLLDAALYEELTLKTSGDETTIQFEAPTAPESWAIPEDAQMLEAFGSAVIGADGSLQQMNYTVTYQYGPAEVMLEVESKPRAEALTVTVPEDTDRYVPLQCIDALQITLYGRRMQKAAETLSSTAMESITSQAAGIVYSRSAQLDMHDTEEDLQVKIDTDIFLADAQYGNQSSSQEETYRDGKCVLVVDGGVPTTQNGIKEEDMRDYCQTITVTQVASPEYWQEVTVTDLGSTYLLEYTYSEDFGNTVQNAICAMFWQDPAFLNRLASDYVTNEVNGYLAIEKYTGMLTASGMYYEGVHTIEGDEYVLSMETNQAVEMPSFSAYSAITEELQSETEPEQKATPLFYHVTGADGQEMWLLGTIHVGDARTGFLPQEIYDAFAASDAVALEVNSKAFEEQVEEDESLQNKLSRAYYYTDGSATEEHLDAELYELAVKHLKASGSYSENVTYMKPFVWQSTIENFYLQQGHQLHSEQGVEERLIKLAEEQEKPIREVESGLFQIQMFADWSEDLQKLLLEDTLDYSAEEYWTQTYELYELWCAGDEEALRKELYGEEDLSEMTEEEKAEYEALLELYEEYDKAMSHDRNAGMLDVAIKYLESGEVIFFAVGLAHLLDDTSGLVDALREAGYTVELVTYYQ